MFFIGTCHDEVDDQDFNNEICELEAGLDRIKDASLETNGGVAHINEHRCGRCLTCFRICPHGAILIHESSYPSIIPDACFGCAQCVSACPARAIEQPDGSERTMEEDFAKEPIIIFACERSAALAEKESRRLGPEAMNDIRVVPVPCAGSVSVEMIMTPFLAQTKRVLVLSCHEGNCRSGNGGGLVSARIRRVLQDEGFPDNQVRYQSIAANEPEAFRRMIEAL
jgi:heterodisulfide reductase subunit A